MKITKQYYEFMKNLNKHNISWCLIKDFDYLMKTGYDNEIDLVSESKNRNKLRTLAKKLGWYESTLNKCNTHLIFWKFENAKPFRIDVHLDKVLATAVPWFKAKNILKDKVKINGIWTVSPKWELAILIVSSLRGRKPKQYRMLAAKSLKQYLPEAIMLLKRHLSRKEVEKYYDYLLKGRVVKLSKSKRLGVLGIIKEKILLVKLFLLRLFNPSPILRLTNKHIANKLKEKLTYSKLNVKLYDSSSILKIFMARMMSDLVIVVSKKGFNVKRIEEVISKLYPDK